MEVTKAMSIILALEIVLALIIAVYVVGVIQGEKHGPTR